MFDRIKNKESWPKYFIFVLFFIAAFFKVPDINGWAYRQVAGLFVFSFIISVLLSKKYHVSVGLFFLITSVFGLVQSGWPQFGSEVISNIMNLLFFTCIGLSLENKYLNLIVPLLCICAIGDAIVMIIREIPHIGERWGFMQAWWVMTNASLDSCFIAIMSPAFETILKNKNIKLFATAIVLIAILLAKSNTGLAVFISAQALFYFKKKDYKTFSFIMIVPSLFILPLHYFYGTKFGENYGRFVNWKTMMTFWHDNINHVIGAGPGTYWIYSQQVQVHKVGDLVFLWMHNDFFQILFEQGYLGLISVLFLYGMMLFRSFKSPLLFSMVFGFGLIACTMYPLHLFFFQLLGIALIYHCFIKNEVMLGST